MAKLSQLDTDVSDLFFKPLLRAYPSSEAQYRCRTISDLDYAALGVSRCISHAKSGHEFLQHHIDSGREGTTVDLFFKSLKSGRRLANLTSLNAQLLPAMARKVEDPFMRHKELKNFDFYAADGHYQKAACFDPKPTKEGESQIATGHFFRLNLRFDHLDYLDVSRPDEGKKKDHDMRLIKRMEVERLRNGAKVGRKVLYAWDKACIDYECWEALKRRAIYFVTEEKSNSAANQISTDVTDRRDPRNEGVVSDYFVGRANGPQLRRVVYTDPRDGTTYTYITNEMTLPAWAIVLMYKQRWNIEKVFHQFKSKMEERKSWASSEEAKQAHGVFECLAHNLALLFEMEIKEREDLTDEVEIEKQEKREPHLKNREGGTMKSGGNFINQAVKRATQRTQRFIRWLRVALYREVPWREAVARLAEIWGTKC
jgi:hypothetical protein